MSLFYKQNAAARFFVDQTNGKVYEVVGGSAAQLCWSYGDEGANPLGRRADVAGSKGPAGVTARGYC